jgi:transcriptional regulator with XRE-family HTH domain
MSSSFAIQLGKNIRAARSALGLSQLELAEQIGIKRQSVNLYEKGKQWPQPVQAQALRRVLGIDVPDDPDTVRPHRTNTLTPEAAKGVRFAALRMSETLTALLREANEAEDHAEAAEADRLRAELLAATQHAAAAHRQRSAAPTRRQRKG